MKSKRIWISLGIVAVLIAIIIIATSSASSPSNTAPSSAAADSTDESAPSPSIATSSAPVSDVPKSAYKDGTYTAVGSYMSPGGPDKIGVQLTLASGVVTDASVTPMPGDGTSAHYQSLFQSGFAAQVVGKPIDSIHLTEISGSSLTPMGFQDALAQIESQAKS